MSTSTEKTTTEIAHPEDVAGAEEHVLVTLLERMSGRLRDAGGAAMSVVRYAAPPHRWIACPLDAESVCELLDVPADVRIDECSLDGFFDAQVEHADPRDAAAQARLPLVIALRETLREHLMHVRGYRVGPGTRRSLVLGRTSSGAVIGMEMRLRDD
jgi:hypothetical protein